MRGRSPSALSGLATNHVAADSSFIRAQSGVASINSRLSEGVEFPSWSVGPTHRVVPFRSFHFTEKAQRKICPHIFTELVRWTREILTTLDCL